MERSTILVLLLAVTLMQAASVLAFVAPSVAITCQQHHRRILIFAQQDSNAPQDSTDGDDDDKETEAARRRLEFLISDGSEGTKGGDDHDNGVEEAPLLSTIGRERREAEIAMLRELEYSDEASDDLWQLWYSERGPKASADLKEIEDELFGDMSEWRHAESRLKEMVKEHGMHFVEPLNRLATLYYMQGRYVDSKRYCEAVLDQKPWHFGALSGIVMVCANLQDMNGARQWASRRLPPIPPDGTTNERRSEWVERAVEDARKALREEEVRIRLAFGRKQRYERKQEEAPQEQQSFEEDAWQ